MRRHLLRRTAGLLMAAFLTTGLLYTGVPVSAEEIDASSETEIVTETADTEAVLNTDSSEAAEQNEDTYEITEPTGWMEATAEEPVPEDCDPEFTFVQANITEESVYNAMMSMKSVYPEGRHYTNDDSYAPYYHYRNGSKIHYTGYGCAAFAFHLSNVAFGDLPDREHRNWDDIRIGDILRINNDQHSVIVIGVSGDTITIAEGNYNSSIHWGRTLSRRSLKNGQGTYIWTRWPEGNTSISLSPTTLNSYSWKITSIRASVSPSSTSINWETSDPNVAIIYATDGTLAGIYVKNPGTCTITCYSVVDPSVRATCTIKVADKAKLEAFVTRLYSKCLNRTPDASGLEHWVSALGEQGRSGADVGKGFVFSDEYKYKNTTNEEYVEMLYNVFLDRASDPSGKAHWVDYLNQGLSREYVFRGFAQSTEYTNICNSYGINRGEVALTQARDQNPNLTKYVNRLYTQALGRAGEADGLNHWCRTIQTGTKTPQQVAESFINSTEFKNKNLSNEEYIKTLYRTFMGREYDQAGLEHWLSEMNKGCDRQNLLERFARSQEFRNIQSSFGL